MLQGRYKKLIVILALVLLIVYLQEDTRWGIHWLLSRLMLIVLTVALIIILVAGFINRERGLVPIALTFFCVLAIAATLKSELPERLKSDSILEATLDDDLAALHLTLRKNHTFELRASSYFSNEIFEGRYKLVNDKIVFLDKPYDNDFVPDTITIVKDKIVLKFSKNGEPILNFATYFDIKLNRVENGE